MADRTTSSSHVPRCLSLAWHRGQRSHRQMARTQLVSTAGTGQLEGLLTQPAAPQTPGLSSWASAPKVRLEGARAHSAKSVQLTAGQSRPPAQGTYNFTSFGGDASKFNSVGSQGWVAFMPESLT